MNSRVCRNILSAHVSSCNKIIIPIKLLRQHRSFFKPEKFKILEWPSQSLDLYSIKHAFHMLKEKPKGTTDKEELKVAAVEPWQSITREDTQHLVMFMNCRL